MIYMEDEKRGRIEIIVGIILFIGVIVAGVVTVAITATDYARALRYFILSGMVSSLITGLLSGMLILSGYRRISDKEK